MKSYVLVEQESKHYLAYGVPISLTPDIEKARRYAIIHSAKLAIRQMLAKGTVKTLVFTVEEVDD